MNNCENEKHHHTNLSFRGWLLLCSRGLCAKSGQISGYHFTLFRLLSPAINDMTINEANSTILVAKVVPPPRLFSLSGQYNLSSID